MSIALIILITHYTLPFTFAATASPSASPTSADKTFTDLQTSIASKAAQYKTEVSKKIENKAFIGTVKELDKQSLTLSTKNGDKKIIVNEYTVYQDITSKKNIFLKDLVKDNYLVALGDVDDKGSLTAKKIIRSKKFELKDNFLIWGQIQSVTPASIDLSKADGSKFNLSLSGSTALRLGSDEASIADVKISNFLISQGAKLTDNSASSSFIYLLNPNGNLKITKPATASASPSATPKKK